MPVTLPSRLTDKLAAVNVLLQSIGEAPVNGLEFSESVDVASAVQVIDEVDLAVQSEGWQFNREDRFTLSPNTDGNVVLPNNTLQVTRAYWSLNGMEADVVERGRKLYDRENHTAVFTAAVEVDLIVLLPFEDLPEVARRYITTRSAKLFQGRRQGSPIVDRVEEDEVVRARAVLEQHQDKTAGPHNQISGNAEVHNALNRSGVRRRR